MNPILQRITTKNNTQLNDKLHLVGNLKQMIQNPEQAYITLMNSNPQFKQFVEQNSNKSIQQLSQEYGVDLNSILSILK